MRNRIQLLRDEQGIALVLAVLVLAVISVSAASVIVYTNSGQKSAFSNKARQSAYTLAQGAISNALAQLTTHYYDGSGQPTDNSSSGSSGWAPSGSQQAPSSSAACTSSSSCMTWSSTFDSTGPFTGTEQAVYHITGVGTTPNPSGTGQLSRTITVEVPVNREPAVVSAPSIWKAVYSGYGPTSNCDMTWGQGVSFSSPVYVKGNLCINQHAGISNPGTLVVGGWVDTGQKGSIGSAASPLSSLTIVGACDGTHAQTPACALTYDAAGHYYSDGNSIYTSAQVANSASFPPAPTVDWASIIAQNTGWSCTGGKSLTAATFSLTGSAYTCTTPSGSLSWDGSQHLAISGNVYASGDLSVGGDIQYSGIGNLFVGGAVYGREQHRPLRQRPLRSRLHGWAQLGHRQQLHADPGEGPGQREERERSVGLLQRLEHRLRVGPDRDRRAARDAVPDLPGPAGGIRLPRHQVRLLRRTERPPAELHPRRSDERNLLSVRRVPGIRASRAAQPKPRSGSSRS